MTLSLREVLSSPALSRATPVVRAGQDALDRPVRWVHSSEVLEIAHLLRGGELLLTGGVVLAAADGDGRRRYARELAARGIAGLAIETGAELPAIPEELLHEAAALGLPVIELRQVVPFVGVTEEINGMLVNESVRGLRAADALSHLLSQVLADGGGPRELMAALGDATACEISLLDLAGRTLGSTTGPSGYRADADAASEVPISVHGMSVARLVVVPDAETDPVVVRAALERAPQILALALARSGAVTAEDRAVRELLRSVRAADTRPEHIAVLAHAAGVPETSCAVGVSATGDGDLPALGALDSVLRQHGRQVLATVEDGTLSGLVVLPTASAETQRRALIADLTGTGRLGRLRVGVGPSARAAARFPHTLAEAERSVEIADELLWPQRVLDTAAIGVELLAHRIGSASVLGDFIEDHLGPVLALGAPRAAVLLETLATYFAAGCQKTETARRLNLQRQALYQRLARAFSALGGDPTGTPRAVGVHLAARLYLGGRADTGGPSARPRLSL
ncbi:MULTISPECIES: PucR family transcriptional regulator [Amycolatopsis]|uniref:PucR family transcriptional regulator ligand-binding domain-containing protein n=1 Tax=Amycolatopsis echigonensis TaxID=2576905 RepID=A0A8E1W2H9_9PSEU|nr:MULTISPECIES: PucR family transcriptional regulator [Amycolatopsis]MBB2502988.1 PucR family transcriptional regulator ligand-binding domain-containing protein [Amycolatopsis echigonensis]